MRAAQPQPLKFCHFIGFQEHLFPPDICFLLNAKHGTIILWDLVILWFWTSAEQSISNFFYPSVLSRRGEWRRNPRHLGISSRYLSRKYLWRLIFTKMNGDFTLSCKTFIPILKITFQINYSERQWLSRCFLCGFVNPAHCWLPLGFSFPV